MTKDEELPDERVDSLARRVVAAAWAYDGCCCCCCERACIRKSLLVRRAVEAPVVLRRSCELCKTRAKVR